MGFTAENYELRVALDPEPCWLWTGLLDSRGYGRCYFRGRTYRAHRIVYEMLLGPVSDDLELDHLCHNADASCRGGPTCIHRRCVNPLHLEPVTKSENSLRKGKEMRGSSIAARNSRKTHCPKGHEYTPENTLHRGGKFPGRICRTCHNAWGREHPKPRKIHEAKRCAICGTEFVPKRSDRILCGSHRCKRLHRQARQGS